MYLFGVVKFHFKKSSMKKEKSYDDEPVWYCKRCLSLNIKQMPHMKGQDYCSDCGATDLASADIEEWKELYKKKYGQDFVKKRELKWPYWC